MDVDKIKQQHAQRLAWCAQIESVFPLLAAHDLPQPRVGAADLTWSRPGTSVQIAQVIVVRDAEAIDLIVGDVTGEVFTARASGVGLADAVDQFATALRRVLSAPAKGQST